MASNKLQALGTRWYNRDFFDIHYFLDNGFTFDENIILDRTGYQLKYWIEYIIKLIPEHFPENHILHQLGEVTETNQKNRIKEHLAQETVNLLKGYIENTN